MPIRRVLNALRGESADTELFVVWDTGGMGRLVGVFTDARLAHRIVAVNKPYYRLTTCRVNQVNEKIHGWISAEKEREIRELAKAAEE